MTTDATPDLETRVQQWLSASMTAWQRDHRWLITHSDDAAALLKHQQAELTACRAEQARLERKSKVDDIAFESMNKAAVEAAAQVSTLTAALRHLHNEIAGLLGAWWNDLVSTVGITNVRCLERRRDEAAKILAALRAASEGAP